MPDPEPYLHPNLANVYGRKVAQLAGALDGDDLASSGAREALRDAIDRVTLTPAADGVTMDVVGDFHVASGGATRGTADSAIPRTSTLRG